MNLKWDSKRTWSKVLISVALTVLSSPLIRAQSALASDQALHFLPPDQALLRVQSLTQGCPGISAVVVELYDAATVKPIVVLPDGSPEAFIPTGQCSRDGPNGHLVFIGLYSGLRIETTEHPRKNEPRPTPRPGQSFEIRGEGRRAVVVDWCCNQYVEQFSPQRLQIRQVRSDLAEQLLLFSKTEMLAAYGYEYRQCLPFSWPTFVLTPDGKAPAWVRLYALRPAEPVEATECSEDNTQLTYDGMWIGSLLKEGLLLVDPRETAGLNLVDVRTGEFRLPLAINARAPRLEEVLEFKRRFKEREGCPPVEDGLTPRGNAITCQKVLKGRYEKQLVEYLFR